MGFNSGFKGLITLVDGKGHKIWSSFLLNFRQPPPTSSRSGTDILLCYMFSDIGTEEYNKNIHTLYAVPLARQQLWTWQ